MYVSKKEPLSGFPSQARRTVHSSQSSVAENDLCATEVVDPPQLRRRCFEPVLQKYSFIPSGWAAYVKVLQILAAASASIRTLLSVSSGCGRNIYSDGSACIRLLGQAPKLYDTSNPAQFDAK
jgi:hypothetical protein